MTKNTTTWIHYYFTYCWQQSTQELLSNEDLCWCYTVTTAIWRWPVPVTFTPRTNATRQVPPLNSSISATIDSTCVVYQLACSLRHVANVRNLSNYAAVHTKKKPLFSAKLRHGTSWTSIQCASMGDSVQWLCDRMARLDSNAAGGSGIAASCHGVYTWNIFTREQSTNFVVCKCPL